MARRSWRAAAACIVVLALAGGCGGGSEEGSLTINIPAPQQSTPQSPFQYQFPPANQVPPAPNSPVATAVVAQAVLIGGASGFFVRPNLILTNWHVASPYLNGNTQAYPMPVVLTDGRSFNGTVVAWDASVDAALVRVAAASSPQGLPMGRSHELRPGNAVFAIGNRLQQGFVYVGGNYVEHAPVGIPCGAPANTRDAVVVAADVANGNSGGPLFNAQGQVVGMVSCMATGGFAGVRGIAIPSETLVDWLNGLDWARIGG
ncbi:S1C family serine protease [Ramlibacter albus]|uniref:Trypsin-like peptidase domain-containing protein n=1 Tax=Ramlibacter albus TaxID=2079448 RepID=A0A923S2D9_9BURK|nr:serine protease [Ramlibacter albus]MBC5764648.1 trypsin-like peptidase domain-containing protein [Ramlibacter albus]